MDGTKESGRKRTVKKTKYHLPYRDTSFDKHLEIIKVYGIHSNFQKAPIFWKDFKGVFNPITISGNNKFLAEIGLLTYVKPGTYSSTDSLIKIANALRYDDEKSAKKELRRVIEKSWFIDIVRKKLLMDKTATEDELIKAIGMAIYADPETQKRQLMRLIDYLKYAELIERKEDGSYILTEKPSPKEPEQIEEKPEEVTEEKPISQKEIEKLEVEQVSGRIPVTSKSGINLNLTININEDTDMKKLKELLKMLRDF